MTPILAVPAPSGEIRAEVPNSSAAKPNATAFPSPTHQTEVNEIIGNLSIANMQEDLGKLTSFPNRYYLSPSGAEASAWLLRKLQAIASGHEGISVTSFSHDWPQNSTIARFTGKTPSAPVTIIGAHIDTFDHDPDPGADDDGSGTVNLIEAFRALVASGFQPSTPVEFHWYSAEEHWKGGSKVVAKKYSEDGVKVKAFLQLDMTAYVKPGSKEVFALVDDAEWTSNELTQFVKSLAETYSRLPVVMTQCGYPCSDHASWNDLGIPSANAVEGLGEDINSHMHSSEDTSDRPGFSWDHTLEFTKVAVAYIYELAV
ncbi:hypothetical protein HGRIS_008990 [Hohenbuehelia grisea]|uniref:Peptide hydrolase n=1 Tax=Hohenbuehelia grisea TaxID=104357 RepID=A0ABR3IZS3_9AGAR